MSQLALTYSSLVAVSFLWGSNFVAVKFLLDDMQPFTISTLRFALTTICFFFYLLLAGHGDKLRVARRDIPLLAFLGLTGILGFNALMYLGLDLSTAIKTSLIAATMPIFITVFSAIILKERLALGQYLGISLSFAGALLVVLDGQLERLVNLSFATGDLLTSGAILSFSLYSVVGRRVMERYSYLTITTYSCLFGTLFFLPLMLWQLEGNPFVGVPVQSWLVFLYTAVGVSFLSLQWWYRGVQLLSPSRSSVFANLVPFFSVTLSWLLLQEPFLLAYLIGALLIITGVYITSTAVPGRREKGVPGQVLEKEAVK